MVSATLQVACQPSGSALRVSAAEDVLGMSSRLVFSTAHAVDTGPRAVTLRNAGSSQIRVTGLQLSGTNANQFRLAAGQATSFTLDPGQTRQVGARFTPTTNGNKYAVLTVVNSSSTPRYDIRLRGVSARGTLGSTEPQLAQLMQLFGYSTNVGFTQNNQATTRAARGDEVLSPYFVRADTSLPVRLFPIARYTGSTTSRPESGHTPKGSAQRFPLYRFPADQFVDEDPGDGRDDSIYTQNQKTFPQTESVPRTFSPSAPFGLYSGFGNYSDDRFNRDDAGTIFHNVRVYPAKDEGGARIRNVWIIAVDVNVDPPDKNFDYQDQVMLLMNARPE